MNECWVDSLIEYISFRGRVELHNPVKWNLKPGFFFFHVPTRIKVQVQYQKCPCQRRLQNCQWRQKCAGINSWFSARARQKIPESNWDIFDESLPTSLSLVPSYPLTQVCRIYERNRQSFLRAKTWVKWWIYILNLVVAVFPTHRTHNAPAYTFFNVSRHCCIWSKLPCQKKERAKLKWTCLRS